MGKFIFIIALVIFLNTTEGVPSNRIVGGNEATTGQFPHQVSLRRNGAHTCGGSIISSTVVLTALHCVDGSQASTLSVRVGSNERFQGGVVINVAKFIQHEAYSNFLNDVAVVFLEKPLIFSKYIQPIKLASKPTPTGASVLLSGWGRLYQDGDVPQKLQYVNVEKLSTEECTKSTQLDGTSLLCLAHPAGIGACNGDSGGPAMWDGEVVGIAGFVQNGCGSSSPDGYASVYYHLDWIKRNAGL